MLKLVALFLLGGVVWAAAGMPDHKTIEKGVASDAVEQYEIVKRQGDKMAACVHAGLVSAAFIQAKDEQSYVQWKATERRDCKRAGL